MDKPKQIVTGKPEATPPALRMQEAEAKAESEERAHEEAELKARLNARLKALIPADAGVKGTSEHGESNCECDFSEVKKSEIAACCYYEFARESPSIVDYFDRGERNALAGKRQFRHHPFTLSLPLYRPDLGEKVFDCSWQRKPEPWRQRLCENLSRQLVAWKFNPFQPRSAAKGFQVCIPPYFNFGLLKDEKDPSKWASAKPRVLDKQTGLEVLTVTIDWENFVDGEIVAAFKKWVHNQRPPGIGIRTHRGRPKDYKRSLERLALLRLRHHHPFEEINAKFPCPTANKIKFLEIGECNRECDLAEKDFHSYFPFLPPDEKPISLVPVQGQS